MPWPAGADNVVLVHMGGNGNADQILDGRNLSANPPTISVTSPSVAAAWPAGSTQQVTWQGSDTDDDLLHYTLFFSPDGGASWGVMATELTTTTFSINVDGLAGTTDARFRVLATDGLHTASAESASVTIPNKLPLAEISDPVIGASFVPGALVVLQGSALDLEDGRLADEKLAWSSDKQGVLGSGPSLPTNTLQPGLHVITLTATDSLGATGMTTTTILVGYQLYLPAVSK